MCLILLLVRANNVIGEPTGREHDTGSAPGTHTVDFATVASPPRHRHAAPVDKSSVTCRRHSSAAPVHMLLARWTAPVASLSGGQLRRGHRKASTEPSLRSAGGRVSMRAGEGSGTRP
jgi:hypothetical protein